MSRPHYALGSVLTEEKGQPGVHFSVWAPNARHVSVVGDFNHWNPDQNFLRSSDSGVWSGFIPGVEAGQRYKYHIRSDARPEGVQKADPYALRTEVPPKTASVVWKHLYSWTDDEWMKKRGTKQDLQHPISIYEMHLGSWRRDPAKPNEFLSYRQLADVLPQYLKELGFTHVEFLPVMEHPFYASWGYQVVSYFAPSARYGSPEDFMHLIDTLHRHDIGVFLDWVPSHFPSDEHGLALFDGTHLYEHEDRRKGFHPDWNSLIFNYGRHEVKEFLIQNALFWLDRYHIDGLRVDAVASMLYLDYSRKEGEWIPNPFGGRENLEAIHFLKELNETVYRHHPDVQMIAEESTAWPGVSRPTFMGGLGFGMKWDMGWMHDTLKYFQKDPVHRKYVHQWITFRPLYMFSENFLLSLSHDEVVHGKGSLLSKMPGDDWQRLANLRSLFSYLYAQPGKKLLFMGSEFGQWSEWQHDHSLDWHLLNYERHQGIQRLIQDLNHLYQRESALYETDFNPEGFEWGDANDYEQSVLSFFRKNSDQSEIILGVFNLTPVPRNEHRLGVPKEGNWSVILNSDHSLYGGSGYFSTATVRTDSIGTHGRNQSIVVNLPPLSAVFLKWRAP